jgi:aryl-alcohol dehydrogenase-like predicted oxidoreductase
VEESLSAVEDLVRRDLVRYFGVGNLSVDQLRLYQMAEAAFSVRCRVVAVQNGFDILHGETNPEHHGVLDHCRRSGVSYVAYSPLARGLLTERYLDLAKVGPGDRLYDEGTLQGDAGGAGMDKLFRLAALARRWDLELGRLALAYTLALPGMGPVIPGASSVRQLEINARAAHVQLATEQQEQIEAVVGRG